MAWVALSLGVASLGMGAASAAGAFGGQPNYPNTSASSKALSDTNAALLPLQRGMTAAQQSGGDYTFTLPTGVDPSSMGIATTGAGWYDSNGNLISADPNYRQAQVPPTQVAGHNPTNSANRQAAPTHDNSTGLTWREGSSTVNGVPITKNADGSYTVSFKGYGQGDIQKAIADQQAKTGLELAQKYDPQFIASALKQQQQADPESFAARAEESKLIQDQINRPINSPVSDMLNQQVQDTLDAARNNRLTDMDTQRLNAAVASAQADRGGSTMPADFAEPLTSGFAGEKRQQDAAQAAMGFLASGSSPEDIAYRREQQNLANLSAEVNGKTPQSQFGSMSGAQSGPTPMVTDSPLPVMPGNQDQAAAQVAIQNAQTTNRFNNNQINPWMQGVSSLIDVGSIAGNMGWKPFAPAS